MKEEHIDFRKEFEEFKKELENSKPIFDDDSIEFNDFDNLISNDDSIEFNDFDNLISNDDFNPLDGLDESDDQTILSNDYPKIVLETDDILMNLTIKKDYSTIEDSDKRKEEFIKDLKEFIDEFESTEESSQLMKYYD
ncbi:MAG: hypothetical protein E7Z75_08845 [Methanobrevibacter olleyae]|uniref:Uncharacterized protein n=1 Tax=Methanobrevibacter olleyae TaxID=294671 RepID=A0A8T3VZU6_METOL|nr:hypothetical protein [Methanobrevibacter olleyae]